MTAHPFDRILTPGAESSGEERHESSRPFQLKLDRRQALTAMLAASSAALTSSPRSLWADEAPFAEGELPTYKGRGLYLVQSRFRELWRAASREEANVLGPYVRGAVVDLAKPDLPEGAPPPPPVPEIGGKGEASRAAGFLAWLTAEEADAVSKEMVVSGVTPYLPEIKPFAPLDPAARKAAVVALAPNHWDKRPAADTYATDDQVAEELRGSLAAVAGEIQIDERDGALVLRRRGGEAFDDASLRLILGHPQVQSIEWDAVATTLALGEEAGELPPRATTEALNEEAGIPAPDATTFALGEEGTGGGTTYALGEEGGYVTTYRLGEEGSATTLALGEEGGVTTYALGEEGSGGVTTYALGEEGGATTFALGEEGGGVPTTRALGEEGGGVPTTKALGEEGGGVPTTQAFGEEGGGIPNQPPASTRALGEEGGTVRPIRPDPPVTPPSRPPVRPNPPRNPPRTTLALGEEGG